MSILFRHSSKQPTSTKQTLLNSLRVTSSDYGRPLPLVYGQQRVPGRLLWYGDFLAIPHTSKVATGGKGGLFGGGSSGSGNTETTYTYQAAVAMALCQGQIQGLQNVWDTKGQLALLATSVNFTVPGGGGSFTPTPPSSGLYYADRGVSRGDVYSVIANDYGSDGSVTLSGTQQTPMAAVGSSPGAGQYTVNTGTGQYTFSGADAGKSVTINYVYSIPNSNSNGQPLQQLTLTLFTGSRPQTAWGYLTSNHPGQDLSYVDVAYVADSSMDLGSSGSLPNFTYEVLALLPFGAGITDAEPSAIITDLLTNSLYGMGWNITLLGDLTQLKSFCVANGIFISPVYDAQQSAADMIKHICELTNSAPFWSEGKLKILPYGDKTAVGNGLTYTPNTQPVFDLTDENFVASDSDPVKISRKSASEAYNQVQLEFLNRANSYNPEIAEDKDNNSIALYGVHADVPFKAHEVTTSAVAKLIANFRRMRSVYIRNQYKFTLTPQFALLDCMDLVTITDPNLGLNKRPVRIISINENENLQLEIEAEDFPWGTATPTKYPHQAVSVFTPAYDQDPGSVNPPYIFEPNNRLSHQDSSGTQQGYQIWMGVSGANANWGGCSVYLSLDGTTYEKIGVIHGAARTGVTTATFASAADPDTTNALSVDLTQSFGLLTTASATDADGFRTLCLVGGELISYQAATLTSPYHYDLGTRIRRAVFNSAQNIIGPNITTSGVDNTGDFGETWTNPGNVGSTVNFAVTNGPFHGVSDRIFCTGFGFSIPATHMITGVEVNLEMQNTVGGGLGVDVQATIMKAGTPITGLPMSRSADVLTAALQTYIMGGTNDLWDTTLTPSDVNNSGFGVAFRVHSATVNMNFSVRNVTIKVYTASNIGPSHATGTQFLRIDDAIFKWIYDPKLIGTTLHFKFTSFNLYGVMEQSLSNATDYTYTIAAGATGTGLVQPAQFTLTAGTFISPNSSIDVNISIPAATLGMHVTVSPVGTLAWPYVGWSAWVSAPGQITVRFSNPTTNTLTLAQITQFMARLFQ